MDIMSETSDLDTNELEAHEASQTKDSVSLFMAEGSNEALMPESLPEEFELDVKIGTTDSEIESAPTNIIYG